MKPGPIGANYKEQIQWRDAVTGKLLAASDFLPSSASCTDVPVGYGCLIYDITNIGHIIALQVLPSQTNATPTTTVCMTSASTATTAGQNSTSAAGWFADGPMPTISVYRIMS